MLNYFFLNILFKLVSGDLLGISQPTKSRSVKQISKLIVRSLTKFIKFPSIIREQRQNQLMFYDIASNFYKNPIHN